MLLCVIGAALVLKTPEAAVTGTVIAAFLVVLPAIFLMYRTSGGQTYRPDRDNIIAQLKYSIPLGAAFMIGGLQIAVDKVIVSSMCSPGEFAVYANGAIEIPIVGIVTASVMAILLPEFVELHKSGHFSKLLTLWRGAISRTSILMFPVMIYLFIMSDEVIRLLFSDKYIASVVPFRIYLLFLIARVTNFGSVEMAANKNKLMLLITGSSLIVNIALSIFLVSMFGYIGAAIGTVITTYFFSIPFHLAVYRKILNTSILKLLPGRKLAMVMICSLVCAPVTLVKLFLGPNDILKLVVTSVIFFPAVMFILRMTGVGDLVSILKALKIRADTTEGTSSGM